MYNDIHIQDVADKGSKREEERKRGAKKEAERTEKKEAKERKGGEGSQPSPARPEATKEWRGVRRRKESTSPARDIAEARATEGERDEPGPETNPEEGQAGAKGQGRTKERAGDAIRRGERKQQESRKGGPRQEAKSQGQVTSVEPV
ncbi:hypothetical protein Tco_0491748 [Tanacetum coccineum]